LKRKRYPGNQDLPQSVRIARKEDLPALDEIRLIRDLTRIEMRDKHPPIKRGQMNFSAVSAVNRCQKKVAVFIQVS